MSNNHPPSKSKHKPPGTPKSGGRNVSVLPSPSCEPIANGPASKPERQPYVTRDEVRRALELEPHPQRRLLVEFLWLTGCRISEALAVRAFDMDLRLNLVSVVTLKRRIPTSRTIPLPYELLERLRCTAICSEDSDNPRPFPWTVRVAYGHVRKALERAGATCTNPHALRHGHAIHALMEGANLRTVSRALGHASISTTSTYLSATAEDVRRDYEKVRW